MTLKDLVPPMELCKQIPEGNFDNSAMAWFVPADTDFPEYGDSSVIIRNYAWAATSERGVYPAPTLAEIVYLRREGDANAATAALKLWLEVNKPDTPYRPCPHCGYTMPEDGKDD